MKKKKYDEINSDIQDLNENADNLNGNIDNSRNQLNDSNYETNSKFIELENQVNQMVNQLSVPDKFINKLIKKIVGEFVSCTVIGLMIKFEINIKCESFGTTRSKYVVSTSNEENLGSEAYKRDINHDFYEGFGSTIS